MGIDPIKPNAAAVWRERIVASQATARGSHPKLLVSHHLAELPAGGGERGAAFLEVNHAVLLAVITHVPRSLLRRARTGNVRR